jgi:hypothetical protein
MHELAPSFEVAYQDAGSEACGHIHGREISHRCRGEGEFWRASCLLMLTAAGSYSLETMAGTTRVLSMNRPRSTGRGRRLARRRVPSLAVRAGPALRGGQAVRPPGAHEVRGPKTI